jgi:hypothetical protein
MSLEQIRSHLEPSQRLNRERPSGMGQQASPRMSVSTMNPQMANGSRCGSPFRAGFRRGTPSNALYSLKHALVPDFTHGSLLRKVWRLRAYIAEALEAQSPSQFVGLSVENNGTAGSTR